MRFFIRQADVSTVDFIKPREAQDQHDSTIPLDSHTEILVAIGSLRYTLCDYWLSHEPIGGQGNSY